MSIDSYIAHLNINGDEPIMINYLHAKKSLYILRSINHKLRQDILKLIDAQENITVTEVYTTLKIEQSVASQHLALMRKAGIVVTRKEGKYIYYKPNYQKIKEVSLFVEGLVNS